MNSSVCGLSMTPQPGKRFGEFGPCPPVESRVSGWFESHHIQTRKIPRCGIEGQKPKWENVDKPGVGLRIQPFAPLLQLVAFNQASYSPGAARQFMSTRSNSIPGLIFLSLRKARVFIIYFCECKAAALREMPTQSAYFHRFYSVIWELVTDCWPSC